MNGYMILSPSPRSQCAVVVSHNGIAKILALPEYVASTSKVSTTHRPTTNGPQSTQAGSLRQASNLTQAKISPGLNLNNIIIMVFSRSKNRAEKNQGKPISRE
jgi:hypothetical protein